VRVKRGCWIAFWAIAAYVVASVGVRWGTELSFKLLANFTMPAWLMGHVKLMAELARGLFPYIAASVLIALGLGQHLPGTRGPVDKSRKITG
jgi:hypothetical protein